MKYTTWRSEGWALAQLLSLATLSCLIPLTAKAQVNTDGTTSTTVNQDGNNFTIEQGDRVGDNLFHSFNEFSVPTMGSALFNNATDIANIFSRVTGSNISSIDGLISANGAANLFLINPNGIIFGENARLNLGGSFFASTADSLLFEGNAEFSATNPQAPPLLEVSIPIGLNFRDNPGDIFVQGDNTSQAFVEVNQGQNFTLVGGDITFDTAIIFVPGGRVELGGLSEAGVVGINENGNLSFPDGIDRADISLTNSDIFVNSDGGGFININARNLDLTGESLFRAGIGSGLGSPGAVAGDIIINATDNISLDGSEISNILESSGEGKGGDINITANSVSLSNVSALSSDTEGQGDAGNIIINATESISLSGSGIFARVLPGATGTGGNVELATTNISLTNSAFVDVRGVDGGSITVNARNVELSGGELGGSFIEAGIETNSGSSTAQAGDITINATDNISLDGSGISNIVESSGEGQGGDINITANSVSLTNGSALSSDTDREGQGNAGNIIINARDSISFSGVDSDGNNSGIFARVSSGATGNGGDVELVTETLSLNEGTQIVTDAQGEGDAGNVTIKASNIFLDGIESGIRSIAGLGNAGEIEITTDSLSLTNDAFLNTNAGGQGNAGRIEINANSVVFNGGSELTSDTGGQGDAGQIIINATESISFNGVGSDGAGSGIFARVGSGATGTGGDVELATETLSLNEGGQIVTDTQGEGDAGNVTIKASNILLDGIASGIRSTAGLGNAGKIKITADSLSLNNEAEVNTSTGGQGDAGTVEIDAKGVAVSGGSEIRSETTGQGDGGNVIINASDSVSVDGIGSDGNGSAIFGRSFVDAEGDAGSVEITTNSLSVTNQASVNVNSSARGSGGNIEIKANSIELNRGTIEAQTVVGEGGNITLQIDDNLILRNNSLMSATAFADADGGNININQGLSDTEFLLFAFPPTGDSGSDIRANADRGDGGRIDITAAGVFGIEFREISAEEAESNSLNDFTVTSEFGQSGETIINRTVDDPTSGLIELPQVVGDASDQISQNPCEQGVGSEFIVTGKGGLPPNVNEALNSEEAQVGLIEAVPSRRRGDGVTGGQGDRETGRQGDKAKQSDNLATEAMPAMGWVFNDKGEVTLTAYKTTDTEIQRSGEQYSSTCKSGIAP